MQGRLCGISLHIVVTSVKIWIEIPTTPVVHTVLQLHYAFPPTPSQTYRETNISHIITAFLLQFSVLTHPTSPSHFPSSHSLFAASFSHSHTSHSFRSFHQHLTNLLTVKCLYHLSPLVLYVPFILITTYNLSQRNMETLPYDCLLTAILSPPIKGPLRAGHANCSFSEGCKGVDYWESKPPLPQTTK